MSIQNRFKYFSRCNNRKPGNGQNKERSGFRDGTAVAGMLADEQRKTSNRKPEEIEPKAEDQAVKIKKQAGG
jgi:hypothetical protein